MMRFYAFERDIRAEPPRPRRDFVVDDSVSVLPLKRHFYEALGTVGELVPLPENFSADEARALFRGPDAVFTQVHFGSRLQEWDAIPKRQLRHTLGSFMLPEYLLDPSAYLPATMNCVTTASQAESLGRGLKEARPELSVFAPRLNESVFHPPDAARRAAGRGRFGVGEGDIHLVYAGRFLATKGLCQLVRSLTLWPDERMRVTLAGNFSPDFPIRLSNATHSTFAGFWKRETLGRGTGPRVSVIPGLPAGSLRELYWSADLFVYPSGHEDENFGFSPREAALCGAPSVVTDFCGLRDLAVQMPWGGVDTYPTAGGIRFSLRRFRRLIDAAVAGRDWDPVRCAEAVRRECDPGLSAERLKRAAERLLSAPLDAPAEPAEALKRLKTKLLSCAGERIAAALIDAKASPPDGGEVDGCGVRDDRRRLIQAIQGLYTTFPEAPGVASGTRYRGFFRVALWPEERAVVEFGFPGPRLRRYEPGPWREIAAAAARDETGDTVFVPGDANQVRLIRELVELGYLVSDE
jgi:glycosyltransferase involved in cell wall biosynthesis